MTKADRSIQSSQQLKGQGKKNISDISDKEKKQDNRTAVSKSICCLPNTSEYRVQDCSDDSGTKINLCQLNLISRASEEWINYLPAQDKDAISNIESRVPNFEIRL